MSLQQELAITESVVMDGRDIGTKVLPNARLKIFLTASTKVRARRRFDELLEKGMKADLMEIEKDIKERDRMDMTRAESPLVQAPDSVLLDTSDMSIKEVADKIISLYRETEKK